MKYGQHRLAWFLLLCVWAIPSALARQAGESGEDFLSASKEWTVRNGDAGQTQYSTLAQINKETIKNLGAAWVSKKFAEGGTSRSTPIVHDGLMFFNAGTRVYALDAKTGNQVWNYQADSYAGPLTGGPGSGAGHGVPNGQGPAVGGGLVYVGLMDCHVIALDEKTGKLVWTQDLKAYLPRKGQSIAAAPMYVNGVVFWSITHQERYVGRVMALDAKDGHELWHFDIIPGPGEPGHETWAQNNEAWKMGGGNVWLPAAIDPQLGLVYYGTGNADTIHGGDIRPGNNLYTCSVIALDVKTGKLRWYYQLTHHDLWEHDLGTPLVLYDIEMGGRMRKGLAAMRKDGHLFLLDRESGKPLLPIQERPVPQDPKIKTSPTQPFPVGDSIIEDCDTYWKGKLPAGFIMGCNFTPPTLSAPNMLQPEIGVIFEPISFNPQTGYFYVQGRTDLMSDRRAEDPYYQDMNSFGLLTTRAPGIHRYDRYELAAIDARTNKIVWKKIEPPILNFGTGGWLSTAGGLAFHRMVDGNLEAFDAKTGDMLWKFQTGFAGGDATPMVYEMDGKQFIAVVEGTAVWSFALGGDVPAGSAPPAAPSIPDVAGPIRNTDTIHAASLLPDMNGDRWRVDEWAMDPYRARVAAGQPVLFVNNGDQQHTFEALDGSWTTGPMAPNDQVTLTFDKPGEYLYHCKDHPWSYGQLIVVTGPLPETAPAPALAAGPPGAANNAPAAGAQSFAAQVARGQVGYARSCAACHMADLSGNGQTVPSLAGQDFTARWQARTAEELFEKTRSTMPPTDPRSLNDEAYREIVAYILQANQISVDHALGAEDLKNVSVAKK